MAKDALKDAKEKGRQLSRARAVRRSELITGRDVNRSCSMRVRRAVLEGTTTVSLAISRSVRDAIFGAVSDSAKKIPQPLFVNIAVNVPSRVYDQVRRGFFPDLMIYVQDKLLDPIGPVSGMAFQIGAEAKRRTKGLVAENESAENDAPGRVL